MLEVAQLTCLVSMRSQYVRWALIGDVAEK